MRLNEINQPSNPELTATANSATSFSDLRDRVLRVMRDQGTVIPTWDSALDDAVHPAQASHQPQLAGAAPVSNFIYEKEIRFHPESGRRSLMIRANTMEDLQALEAQILGYR